MAHWCTLPRRSVQDSWFRRVRTACSPDLTSAGPCQPVLALPQSQQPAWHLHPDGSGGTDSIYLLANMASSASPPGVVAGGRGWAGARPRAKLPSSSRPRLGPSPPSPCPQTSPRPCPRPAGQASVTGPVTHEKAFRPTAPARRRHGAGYAGRNRKSACAATPSATANGGSSIVNARGCGWGWRGLRRAAALTKGGGSSGLPYRNRQPCACQPQPIGCHRPIGPGRQRASSLIPSGRGGA